MVTNEFVSGLISTLRLGFRKGLTHLGKRDLYEIFGYPQNVTYELNYIKYQRGDIAARIVEAYPDACWSSPPILQNDKESSERNSWEQEVDELFDSISLFDNIRQADMLAQIGRYSILFIGYVDGQTDLTQPVTRASSVAYVKAFSEKTAKIKQKVADPTDPRFGLPEIYDIYVEDNKTIPVHYTRVIHILERNLDDSIYGCSILERIYNRLEDWEKVIGSSAEIWWLNSRGGFSLEADSDADLGSDDEKEELKKQVEAYQHNLTRMIRTKGLSVKPLVQEVDSPKDNVSVIISAISGATGIPQRILVGSERGELASSQDEKNWVKRIEERRIKFCEPVILNKIVDSFIAYGVLSKIDMYEWEWSNLVNIDEKTRSETAKNKASAIATYANSPEADWIVSPRQFVEEVLGLEYKEDELAEIIAKEQKEMAESGLEDEEGTELANGN